MARYEFYDEDGSSDREECPHCGDTFMGDYGDRQHCGKCGHTEFE
jgi:small subunit ribosomal protein S27Ae